MDWSNETVLEFVELLEREPCIWNPKSESHKNRNLVNDAWIRIMNELSVHCSVEELKKKRNILLTQYRQYLKKIKDSTKRGSGAEDIYKPSWFAFDAIHNYMGTVYDHRQTISVEIQESIDESSLSHDAKSEESNIERSVSRESSSQRESIYFPVAKRQRGDQDLFTVKKEKDAAFSLIENKWDCRENEKETNECDLYGQLLAQKLKTLDADDRLELMNNIDNIVFKYIKNVRKRSKRRSFIDPQYLCIDPQGPTEGGCSLQLPPK